MTTRRTKGGMGAANGGQQRQRAASVVWRAFLPLTLSAVANFISASAHAGGADGAGRGDKTVVTEPWLRYELALETGALLGVNNPADYQTLPQFLTLRVQPWRPWRFGDFRVGSQMLFGVAGVAFTGGGESYYAGAGVGFRHTLFKSGSRWELYADGRFFVGATDSKGPPFGQGQDLTFSAVGSLGATYQITPRAKIGVAFMYQHFSNGTLSEPEVENIGLDTVGPSVSFSYSF